MTTAMTEDEAARAERLARDRSTVEAFVVRARRIEAHSFAQDRDSLAGYEKHEIKMRIEGPGEVTISVEMPPEEQLESAAARIRPLILQEEQVHNQKVLN